MLAPSLLVEPQPSFAYGKAAIFSLSLPQYPLFSLFLYLRSSLEILRMPREASPSLSDVRIEPGPRRTKCHTDGA